MAVPARRGWLGLGLAVAWLIPLAEAETARLGGIVVTDPRVLETAPGTGQGIGTLVLRNETDQTEALVEIRGPFETVTLRQSVEIGDRIRDVPVDRLAIPRGATITFSPEALHVFFDGPKEDGAMAGDRIPTTFVFETAGALEVFFLVTPSSD